jgi:hypothetical protein
MRRIAASLVPTSSNPGADLTWSPDGKRLISDVTLDTASGAPIFEVYDCSSGKGAAVATQQQFLAQVPLFHRHQEVPPPELAWSPNSQRLLAYDTTSGVIEVFGPKSLSSGIAG